MPVFVMFTGLAGAAGLVLGLLTCVAALAILGSMILAPSANHLYSGFFMNWSGTRGGEGDEDHLLANSLRQNCDDAPGKAL